MKMREMRCVVYIVTAIKKFNENSLSKAQNDIQGEKKDMFWLLTINLIYHMIQ